MEIYLNHVTGLDDAAVALHMTKRKWTPELNHFLRVNVPAIYNRDLQAMFKRNAQIEEFNKNMDLICKYGPKHITLLRFIDMSVNVRGLHRGGQDDWDSHAKRFDNRIIRASTRMADFKIGEMSDWYRDRVIPTDIALAMLGVYTPDTVEHNGQKYVRCVNGYVREDLKDSRDATRGLQMLCIPSDFLFKINICEWAHVYKMRNKYTHANPEVQQCAEMIQDELEKLLPWFDREFLARVDN